MTEPVDRAMAFEAAYISTVIGDVERFRLIPPDNVVTALHFAPPFMPSEVVPGEYRTEVCGMTTSVVVRIIETPQQDILRQLAGGIVVGAVVNETPLRFEQLSDHRGVLPFVLVTVVFDGRVADWLQYMPGQTDPSLLEDVGVTEELPKARDKILALHAWNAAVLLGAALRRESTKYADVTLFAEVYFMRGTQSAVLQRFDALAAQDALRKVVYREHFGSAANQVRSDLLAFHVGTAASEKELRDAVLRFMDQVVKHHVEDRRWVHAFWNDTRRDGGSLSPKREPDIQPTLDVLFIEAFEREGVRVSRETAEGAGSLDFCFSQNDTTGALFKVNLELKLAHHGRLEQGMRSQLPRYMRANRSKHSIFCVMWFKDEKGVYFDRPTGRTKDEMEAFITRVCEETSQLNSIEIQPVLIDASIRESASVA